MKYVADEKRYDSMQYNKCGESGLKLPAVSLGLWHNFGDNADYENMCKMCFTAFDNGITHFDLANNYGPEAGSAESPTEMKWLSAQKQDIICGRDLTETLEAESILLQVLTRVLKE